MGCSMSTSVKTPPLPERSAEPRPSAQPKYTAKRLSAPSTKTFSSVWKICLEEKLGSGQVMKRHQMQFGVVYHADERTPQPGKPPRVAAVKVVSKRSLTPEDKAAIAVEVRAMELLNTHDNFVRLYDFFDEPEKYYIVLEKITGGELFDRIVEKEKYTEREARAVFKQMAAAISYAHSKNIAHRDLKPENVLLRSRTDDTQIKIADMGFAKILSPGISLMTTPCGTPGYVAPEVISGVAYSVQSDIWSMGVILFILLSGYPPFHDDNQAKLFEQIKAGRYHMDPAVWSMISPGALDLVQKVLVVDPLRRLTAEGVLQHPWMTMGEDFLPDVALSHAVEQLKVFNARRRLKKAINSVRSTVRMKILLAAKTERTRSSASAITEDESKDSRTVTVTNALHKVASNSSATYI